MTNTYGPEIDRLKMVDSIFYHTPNGVWAPGIAFPTGGTLPTINQSPGNDDPHEGDFFFLTTNGHLHQLQKPSQNLQWSDLQTAANAITWCGTSVPGNGEGADLALFNRYDSGNPRGGEIHQKIDGVWRNIGSNQTGLPLSTAAISFKDSSKTFRQANLGLLIVHDDGDSPLLATDVGLVVKKDITAGGFVGANQGELWLGHGRGSSTDVPKIVLTHSSDSYFSTTHGGEAYDTLYLRKYNGSTSAHLDLGNLTVHGNLTLNYTTNSSYAITLYSGYNSPTEKYVYPSDAYVGLGSVDHPYLWVDTTTLNADNIKAFTGSTINVLNTLATGRITVSGELKIPTSAPSPPQDGDIWLE